MLTSSYLDSKAVQTISTRNNKLHYSLQANKHVAITPQTSNAILQFTTIHKYAISQHSFPPKTESHIRYCSVSINSLSYSSRPSGLFRRRILQIFRLGAIREFILPAAVDHYRIIYISVNSTIIIHSRVIYIKVSIVRSSFTRASLSVTGSSELQRAISRNDTVVSRSLGKRTTT